MAREMAPGAANSTMFVGGNSEDGNSKILLGLRQSKHEITLCIQMSDLKNTPKVQHMSTFYLYV